PWDLRREISPPGRSRYRGYPSISFLVSPALALVVDGVSRNLDDEIRPAHLCLAGQARSRFQAPRLVEQVFLFLFGRYERVEPRTQDHVAGRAGAGLLARMLDIDVVFQEHIAERHPGFRVDLRAFRAQGRMGQYPQL